MIESIFLDFYVMRDTVYDKTLMRFTFYVRINLSKDVVSNRKKEKKMKRKTEDERKMYELTEEEYQRPITKNEAKQCKHRLERRWYRRLVELNILIIALVVGICIVNWKDNMKDAKQVWDNTVEEVSAELEEEQDTAKESKKAKEKKTLLDIEEDDIPDEMYLLVYGIVLYLTLLVGIYYVYAYYRSMSLRITEKNFPEVYELVEDYAKKLGIKTPKVYVMQSSGALNAFSTFLIRKQWIMINSELFEIAYREHKDMDSLKFVIAHEMAHIYYGHATFHYQLSILFSNIVPVISQIASRTREYSCDRLAQRITGVDGIDAMLALIMDRHLYKMVDKEDYLQEAKSQRGFFLWVANLFADHPVSCKRIVALEEGRGSGKVY